MLFSFSFENGVARLVKGLRKSPLKPPLARIGMQVQIVQSLKSAGSYSLKPPFDVIGSLTSMLHTMSCLFSIVT